MTSQWTRTFGVSLAVVATLAVSGCSMSRTDAAPAVLAVPAMQGSVHGGNQPVVGASIYLFAANVGAGYAGATQNILTKAVTTDGLGAFSVTGDYTCTAGQQMYLVALGGNAGAGNNAQAGFLSALGDCNGLTSTTFVFMNEVVTVGSALALAPFMQGYNALGTTTANSAGPARAFASVNKLVNITNGSAVGPALAAGATAPSSEINTIANVLAYCANSAGGTASGTACGTLFGLVTPAGGTAPTDTIGAALAIAHNPALNTNSLYLQAAANGPFQPTLTHAPSDFSLAISYPLAQLQRPSSTAIDAAGNVWVANAAGNSVTVLSQGGTPVAGSPFTDVTLSTPAAVAIDLSGNGWVANSTGTAVTGFTVAGEEVGTLTRNVVNPSSVAFDAAGDAWVGSAGNSLLLEFNAQGRYVQQAALGVAPVAVVIDPK